MTVLLFVILYSAYFLTGVIPVEHRITSSKTLQLQTYYDGPWQNVCFQQDVMTVEVAIYLCSQRSIRNPAIYEWQNSTIESSQYSGYTIECDKTKCGPRQIRNQTLCHSSTRIDCSRTVRFSSMIGNGLLQHGLVGFSASSSTIAYDESYNRMELLQLCYDLGFNSSTVLFAASTAYSREVATSIYPSFRMECVIKRFWLLVCGFQRSIGSTHTRELEVMCARTKPVYKLESRGSTVGGILYTWLSTFWGTVCSDRFGQHEAIVACRSLGFNGTASFSSVNSTVKPALASVTCNGSEPNLHTCDKQLWLPIDCRSNEVVRLTCEAGYNAMEFRLRYGNATSGVLEVWDKENWRLFCYPYLSRDSAAFVCKALGFAENGAWTTEVPLGIAAIGRFVSGWIMSRVDGTRYMEVYPSRCFVAQSFRSRATYLGCQQKRTSKKSAGRTGMLRLGRSAYVPMIEYGSELRAVSYSSYTITFGRLACESIGLPSRVVLHRRFAVATRPVDVYCASGQRELGDCYGLRLRSTSASSLMCLERVANRVRLVGNTVSLQMGLPQFSAGGDWIGICFDRMNSTNSIRVARLLCRERRFRYHRDINPILFSANKLRVVGGQFTNVQVTCGRSTYKIQDCDFERPCSATSIFFGLACPRTNVDSRTALRLTGEGNGANAGYLQIRLGGVWGYVCNDRFTNVAAKVACRNMAKPFSRAEVFVSQSLRSPPLWIWLDDVTCNGHERDLLQCGHRSIGEHNCNANEVVAIHCAERDGGPLIARSTPIRLTGGSNVHEGRVEVQISGQWRTICYPTFNAMDATVVCRNLGRPSLSVRVTRQKYYPETNGLIYRKRFGCLGHERYLADCPITDNGGTNCSHRNDVGVICGDGTQSTENGMPASSTPTTAIAIIVVVFVVIIAFVTTVVCLRRRRVRAQQQRRQRSTGAGPSVSQSSSTTAPPPSYSMYLRYDNRNGVMNMGFHSGDNPPTPDSAGAPPKYDELFPVTSPSDSEAPENVLTPPSAPLGAVSGSGISS